MSDALRLINLSDMTTLNEDELLDRAREGDKSAFGTLYLRHKDAARRVASMCTNSAADAEDAVAEGFARVFAALPRMSGRQIVFRPYLLTCVRNAATDRIRRERRIDLREQMPDTPGAFTADDFAMLGVERNLVGEALQALPERWRTVLWLTEVEGMSPAEVSERIGIKPNAVAALAYRARKGLREAYLQAHLRAEASQECRGTVSRLGNYVRGELPDRDKVTVQSHLDACGKCRGRRDELTDVNATLRHAFLPVPLLLAGMERKFFSLSQITGWWSKGTEYGLAQAAADSPLTHKALAGVAAVALAIGGTAVPKLVRDDAAKATVEQAAAPAAAAPASTRTSIQLQADQLPMSLELMVAPFKSGSDPAQADPAASAASAPAPASSSPPASTGVEGGTRNRILPVGSANPGSGRAGESRQSILDPSEEGDTGPLAGSPLGAVLETAVDTVDALVPLDVTVSVPGIAEITTSGGSSDLGSLSIGTGGVALDVTPVLGALTGSADTGSTPLPAGASVGILSGVTGLVQNVTGLVGSLLP
jgi:RNA polymerase sigma factor (sigma-70 family)